jgi:MORN repeat
LQPIITHVRCQQKLTTPAGQVQPAPTCRAAVAPQIRSLQHGHVYRGGVLKGMKQGLGQLEYSNGCQYNGEYDADEMDGYGVVTFASGGLYQGQVMLLWWNPVKCHTP